MKETFLRHVQVHVMLSCIRRLKLVEKQLLKLGKLFLMMQRLLAVCDPAQNSVSHVALKLISALDAFPIVTDKSTTIDVVEHQQVVLYKFS
ncbi:putative rRNA methylase YqxC with S4 and FtsJ domains [Bartonella fuyuanensis]|uniref:Putative rRNA methylase YqxC with S4 and FtsJ domains n=1 Tax=Bartonella fuyuanensis TaxID=1460968 RepID=A0A840E7T6_9HYPH|nr:putative rRNA methylase YqxC with S4 and FtsJ domains [Bartonella fuyuanensis]